MVSAAEMSLGERLVMARRIAGYLSPRAATAGVHGVSARALLEYEADEKDPSSTRLGRLARRYDVSADWLLGLSENRESA